jgi:hypothetical protein
MWMPLGRSVREPGSATHPATKVLPALNAGGVIM